MVDSARERFSYSLTKFRQVALKDGYEKVAEGAYCEVWLSKKAIKILKKAPPKDRGRIGNIFEHLCEQGPEDLNEEQFKAEGRFPTGGQKSKNVMIYVGKSYQLRVYGCWNDGPPRQFECPEAVIKKKNRADQEVLKRVARNFGE
ncbi:hypothetical protein [Celeribacter ethanolicus]|uniref:hypothetical protein n=1 Tax=Celeribacter ethanolicus TaxID=1758178 RepID=UPI0012DBFC72|nr:hypothetical protein [Celeribacter ethanolicus]